MREVRDGCRSKLNDVPHGLARPLSPREPELTDKATEAPLDTGAVRTIAGRGSSSVDCDFSVLVPSGPVSRIEGCSRSDAIPGLILKTGRAQTKYLLCHSGQDRMVFSRKAGR